MSEKELKSLPSDTVRLIGSSQVITSVFSVVKELVENSFDAECTSLEIKLENYGLDKIEVRDNGSGIKQEVISLVAKRHHTSKISSFSDLECLETYGFRGEALGSLCAVSTLSVTTKTAIEDVSHTYTFDNQGNILSKLPSHLGQGTTVTAMNIFKNVPVRRQFYNTVKKKKEELKKVEDLLMAYGIIRPDVRIILRNNKDIIWQKTVQSETRCVLFGIFGRNAVAQMEHKTVRCDETKVNVDAFLPKTDCEVSITSRSTSDRCFLAVNKRPVQLKDFEKVVKQHYCHHMKCDGRYPMFYISITVPSGDIDVNVDPNKTKVMLHHQPSAVKLLTSLLEDLYGPIQKVTEPENTKTTDILNDSNLSNQSFDSSFDATVSERSDMERRPFLKEKSSNIDAVGKSVNSRFTSVKSNKNKGSGQISDDNFNFDKGCVNVLNDVDRKLENPIDELLSEGATMELGNRLVVYHTGSIASDNSEETTGKVKSNESGIHVENGFAETVKDAEADIEKKSYCPHSSRTLSNTEYMENTQTKVDKGSFDILDDDLEKLLRTPNKTKDESERDKEVNTTDNMLAEIDITLVGDIGEFGKKVDGKESRRGDVRENLENSESEENPTKILDWSKGTAEKVKDGVILKPVQLLAGGSHMTRKRPPSPNQDPEMTAVTPPVKRKSSEFNTSFDQPKLYDMVGKSPAEKFSLGFLAFSKEMRPKVLEDNPDSSYDEITTKVRQLWQELPDLDKKQFVDVGKTQVQDLKKKVSEKKRLTQKLDRRLQAVNGTPSIKDQLLAANKMTVPAQSAPVKSVKLPFCLKNLQDCYMSGLRQTQTQQEAKLKLIGPLKFYNSWVCCLGNEIQVLNPHRVEETLLHRELMENHVIPAAKLENTIGLNANCVGGSDLYQKLLEMVPANTVQTYVYIEDKRLKANGIEIRCHMNQDSDPVLKIVGLATCMPMYGVRDLQEILELIVHSGGSTLYQARPLKVSFYLQGEAVRMVRQRPVHRSREDMLELLEQMEDSLPANCFTCLHNKTFLKTVYNLNDVPASQSV